MAEHWPDHPGHEKPGRGPCGCSGRGRDQRQAQPDEPEEPAGERFAALIRTDRDAIVRSFARRLEESHNPLMKEPCSRKQVLAMASEIIADVAESVRAGAVRIDDGYKLLCWTFGEVQAQNNLSRADALRASVALFEVAVDALTGRVRDDPALLPSLVTGILALNKSTALRIRETTLAYTGRLLDRVHQAHLSERRRIARELHDRLGEGLSGALRQLELAEITCPESAPGTALARDALVEGMRRLRLVISDLRQDPVTSLEKALTAYVESIAADVCIRLRVSGDETWASPTVIDETYLIMREAIRNSIRHAEPRLVLIGVDVDPRELRAWVEDDGRGFDAGCQDPAPSATAGLASMRERAELIGGTLTITSAPGQGTEVELLVPLPGSRDE